MAAHPVPDIRILRERERRAPACIQSTQEKHTHACVRNTQEKHKHTERTRQTHTRRLVESSFVSFNLSNVFLSPVDHFLASYVLTWRDLALLLNCSVLFLFLAIVMRMSSVDRITVRCILLVWGYLP